MNAVAFRTAPPIGEFSFIVLSYVIKRNEKAFSLNAIGDVRRRQEMIFLNISEIIRPNDFKIYRKVDLHSLYISTGNDVINYFRSASNRTNV